MDLGCGFGWFCRWARERGAAHVLGLDVSRRMLERAKAETSDPAIVYRPADLEHLTLPEAAFDLAYSSLTLHYLPDLNPPSVRDGPPRRCAWQSVRLLDRASDLHGLAAPGLDDRCGRAQVLAC